MLSNTLRLRFCYLKIIYILHQRYHPKVIGHILKSKQKNKCVCFHEIMQLNIMKMTMKMKNRSHRYNINRPRCRHGRKYSKYMCLTVMILIFTKQYLSNISFLSFGFHVRIVLFILKICNLSVLVRMSFSGTVRGWGNPFGSLHFLSTHVLQKVKSAQLCMR